MAFDPKCLDASVDFGSFNPDDISLTVASVCDFKLRIPNLPIPPKFKLPPIPFPPPLPIPKLSFTLSCDLNKPIDISAGLKFGGGKIPCVLPNPDEEVAA